MPHKEANAAGHDKEDRIFYLWSLLTVFDSSFQGFHIVNNGSSRAHISDLNVVALGSIVLIALIVMGYSGYVVTNLIALSI